MEEAFGSLNKLNLDQTINLIYLCFKWGAKKENQEVDFTADDVADWLEDDLGQFKDIGELMISQMSKIAESKNQPAPQRGA